MDHLGQVAKNLDRLRATGTNVLVVSQSPPAVLARQLRLTPYPFPVVGDPDRAAYRAFGLERTAVWKFFRPDVVLKFLWSIVRLVPPKIPYRGDDVLQLGGDFVLARDGRIEFAYRSRAPTDRPSVRRVLAAIPETPR